MKVAARTRLLAIGLGIATVTGGAIGVAGQAKSQTEVQSTNQLSNPPPNPSSPPLDNTPPSKVPNIPGIKILFGGNAEDMSSNWQIKGKPATWLIDNGAMIASGPDAISTKELFADFQLHVEFRVPFMPDRKGQNRGNSGVFLQGRYEVQVLDSYGISVPGSGDCGAIYTISAPLVNACKAPLQWQTYDIVYRSPRSSSDKHELLEPPRATVFLNGILVQNQTVIPSTTHAAKATPGVPAKSRQLPPDWDTPGPITLQYHGCKVAFRNIWILPLALKGSDHY